MLKFGRLIASGIKWIGSQVGIFGNMAERSPNKTAWMSLLGGAAGVLGIKPEWVETAGSLLMRLGQAMQ